MRTFIKRVLTTLFVAAACLVFVSLVVFGLMAALKSKGPAVKKGSILVFDMSVNITDGPAGFDPQEAVHEIAQGRVWAGRDAERIGLIDELGGLGKAIAYAAQKAKLGTDWSVAELPEESGLLQTIVEMVGGGKKPVARTDAITTLLGEIGEDLRALRTLNDPVGVYALMPENILIK
jgi:hypothetical protein